MKGEHVIGTLCEAILKGQVNNASWLRARLTSRCHPLYRRPFLPEIVIY